MQSRQSITGMLDARSAIASPIDNGAEPLNLGTLDARQSGTLKGVASAVGKFLLHFLEMAIAMGVGMGIFAPVKGALVSQGYTALLDTSSLHFQVWMNLFMVVPMVLWMRVRGCSWRHGAEMGGAMIVPTACVLLLCRLGVTDVLPWFTTSLSGLAMFLGMLGIMLYRREMYTGGYSIGWIRWHRAFS
jgi:hypothetical protein